MDMSILERLKYRYVVCKCTLGINTVTCRAERTENGRAICDKNCNLKGADWCADLVLDQNNNPVCDLITGYPLVQPRRAISPLKETRIPEGLEYASSTQSAAFNDDILGPGFFEKLSMKYCDEEVAPPARVA